ncbi:MAG: 1-acyl-sn-glycerol-3-phosphate acyltransferase [Candidatus Eremiobacteraeota bacterium]|nr:1-acyl-sn-glycerol-3-phosphate acyltransferase [Candidatus Eremiobacteraeota bacterium]
MTPFAIVVRGIAAYNLYRHMNLRVVGLEHVPRRGAAVLAARHYHHLFDGAALVMGLPRQPHIFVALDWTRTPRERFVMETVCKLANWPVALRGDNLAAGTTSAFARSEVRTYVRRSIASAAKLLQRGKLLAIFPEGYPTIDPAGSRKPSDDSFLPFASGLLAIVERAERLSASAVPVLPVGFRYVPAGAERFDVTMRVGAPLQRGGVARAAFMHELEARVRALSQ